jgi:archaeal type IV pilus assembly protein PilA
MNKQFKTNMALNLGACIAGLALYFTPAQFFAGVLLGYGFCGAIETLRQSHPSAKKLARDSNAVSPVIGVILMVAITVVLAAIVFVLVSQLGEAPNETPRLSMQHDGHGNYTVISTDEIPLGDTLSGCGAGTPAPTYTPAGTTDGFLHAGDKFRCAAGQLTIVHRPTDTILYQDA